MWLDGILLGACSGLFCGLTLVHWSKINPKSGRLKTGKNYERKIKSICFFFIYLIIIRRQIICRISKFFFLFVIIRNSQPRKGLEKKRGKRQFSNLTGLGRQNYGRGVGFERFINRHWLLQHWIPGIPWIQTLGFS